MNWKSTALVSGPAVVATWLFSTPAAAPTSTPAPAVAVQQTVSTSEIERQAERLQAKLHADAEYHAPSRNPFRFSAPAVHQAPAIRPVEVPSPIVLPPPRPAVRLDGIATDGADATLQRTAILNTGSDVALVREGESAAGYRVTKIDDDAVTLEAGDGAIVRLTLRP